MARIRDELRIEVKRSKNKQPCALSKFLKRLSPTDAAELWTALAKKGGAPVSAIYRVVARRGYQARSNSLRVHRNGSCPYCAEVVAGLRRTKKV